MAMHPRLMIVTESRRGGWPCWVITRPRSWGYTRHTVYTAWVVAQIIEGWEGPIKFRISPKTKKAAQIGQTSRERA